MPINKWFYSKLFLSAIDVGLYPVYAPVVLQLAFGFRAWTVPEVKRVRKICIHCVRDGEPLDGQRILQ